MYTNFKECHISLFEEYGNHTLTIIIVYYYDIIRSSLCVNNDCFIYSLNFDLKDEEMYP